MTSDSVRQRMAEVEKAILDRAPEHDLVPSLDRIREVCGLLGDPQKAFRAVHLTGTNGKTSTTRLVERLLREHGLRTGRFTSPHLVDVRERIAVDGRPLTPERFVATYEDVAPYVDLVDQRRVPAGEPRMTFFEVLVAMAYAAFADAPVEVAAVEVGMGGSWDATNVLDAQVAVVLPIALDHQRFLGYDVASIAAEKAGIIKPGAVAVLADQPPDAAGVLLRRCAEVGVTPLREGLEFGVAAREIAVGGQLLTLAARGTYEDVFLPLYGEHQARNAACAVAAVEALLGADGGLDAEVVRTALADADSPGRLEVVRRGPTVIVDAAHNPAGAAVLADAVRESFTFTRLVGIVGDPRGQGRRGHSRRPRAGARRGRRHALAVTARHRPGRARRHRPRRVRRGPGARRAPARRRRRRRLRTRRGGRARRRGRPRDGLDHARGRRPPPAPALTGAVPPRAPPASRGAKPG